ncbi:MAG: MATE family efflux transporter [Spirochaetales bacterium]|uniref:MATE family efflux transporter n=1 Tax=Candidatus Thalassospirochaeta sargassi TaxID=3119039 RepID=A0AAJ1MJP9_9SPIO|nr:MATE family efflux transporter [Spirochaetales bacterium]
MDNNTADLTKGSLTGHLRRLAVPASTGAFFNTMYNVVDTYWAGRLSTDSLAALSINFPMYMLVMALGVGFSGAAAALISNAIGAGREEAARKYLARIITVSIISFFITGIILFFFLEDIFILLNSRGAVLSGAVSYARIIIFGMPVINTAYIFSAALAARGDTKSYRNALIVGFLLNIGLDPLFMYVFNMQEAGVALATVIIQVVTTIYLFSKIIRIGGLRKVKAPDFVPTFQAVREILSQAVPATMNFLTMALGTFVITWFISAFGRNPVAAYGAAVRVEQIALVPSSGLNTALAALVGQNNGAENPDRVRKSFRLSLLAGAGLMIVILPPVLIFGRHLIGLFTETEEVIKIGYNYLLLQGFTFYSYIILFQSNSLLQGLKKPAMIMWMGLYRQIAAPAAVFYLLCFTFGMAERGVWTGLIFINWSAAVMTLLWAAHVLRRSSRY